MDQNPNQFHSILGYFNTFIANYKQWLTKWTINSNSTNSNKPHNKSIHQQSQPNNFTGLLNKTISKKKNYTYQQANQQSQSPIQLYKRHKNTPQIHSRAPNHSRQLHNYSRELFGEHETAKQYRKWAGRKTAVQQSSQIVELDLFKNQVNIQSRQHSSNNWVQQITNIQHNNQFDSSNNYNQNKPKVVSNNQNQEMKNIIARINETLKNNQKEIESQQQQNKLSTNDQVLKQSCDNYCQSSFYSNINTSHSKGIIQDCMLFTFGNQQMHSVLSREEI